MQILEFSVPYGAYTLYSTGLNFHELLFLIILLKKFREYAVEAGDDAMC